MNVYYDLPKNIRKIVNHYVGFIKLCDMYDKVRVNLSNDNLVVNRVCEDTNKMMYIEVMYFEKTCLYQIRGYVGRKFITQLSTYGQCVSVFEPCCNRITIYRDLAYPEVYIDYNHIDIFTEMMETVREHIRLEMKTIEIYC